MPVMKKAPARRMVSKAAVKTAAPKPAMKRVPAPVPATAKPPTPKPSASLAPSKSPTINREAWLAKAIDLLRPEFIAQGTPLPEIVRASIGFTRARKALAECWHSGMSKDNVHEIFIIPTNDLEDVVTLFGILTHECCHAALPDGTGHKRPFVALGTKMLLEGPPKVMIGQDAFRAKWAKAVEALGPFPTKSLHAPTNSSRGGSGNPKKRKLRMQCDECGMTFRLAEKWVTPKLQCPDRDCTGMLHS